MAELTYDQAVARQPVICHDARCPVDYPHPHCSRCGEALLWNADATQWEHVGIEGQVYTHSAMTLAGQPEKTHGWD